MIHETTEVLNRRDFLSKSFKAMVGASVAIMATKVPAYRIEPGQDSTDVVIDIFTSGTDVIPPPIHSSGRSWR